MELFWQLAIQLLYPNKLQYKKVVLLAARIIHFLNNLFHAWQKYKSKWFSIEIFYTVVLLSKKYFFKVENRILENEVNIFKSIWNTWPKTFDKQQTRNIQFKKLDHWYVEIRKIAFYWSSAYIYVGKNPFEYQRL